MLVNAFGENLKVVPENITKKFREAFETFTPGVRWNLTHDSSDILRIDGDTASASYLVVSKDPWTAGTQTSLETIETFQMPVEAAIGLHTSQRAVGTEFNMEFVSTDTIPSKPELAIAAISQSTSTLTVTTQQVHNLKPGMIIGIYGVSDTRFNHYSCVVATIQSPTVFTVTSSPAGALTSITATGPNNEGYVYFRSALGQAQDGINLKFENATATNATGFIRSAAGDALMSGTVNGNQSVTIGSSASAAIISTAFAKAWRPTTEYKLYAQADRMQWLDQALDTTAASSVRWTVSQVVPDPNKEYKLRFRVENLKGRTKPIAKIVTVSKSGSTLATIVTDRPHGLTTSSRIQIYGVRNQTSFANQATSVVPTTIVNDTTFTVTFGASATATSGGGLIFLVNGEFSAVSACGVSGVVGSQVSVANNLLTVIGNTTWTGVAIGDYVNLEGVYTEAGVSAGVDGVYCVENISTTTLTLSPIGSTTLPTSLSSTDVGGALVRRSDLRLSFVRIFKYLRERVEVLTKGSNDIQGALPVQPVATVAVDGTVNLRFNALTTDVASSAITSSATTGTITPTNNSVAHIYQVVVTALSGTNPTMDVVVQESDDNGTNWYDVWHFPRITASGIYRSPMIRALGTRVRYVQTLSGTSPSFTRSINRISSPNNGLLYKNFISRTIAPNTLDSTTSTFLTLGCSKLQMTVHMGAITTTAPVIALEGSEDGTNWYELGTLTPTANAMSSLSVANVLPTFVRADIKTAGSGATLNYLQIRAME